MCPAHGCELEQYGPNVLACPIQASVDEEIREYSTFEMMLVNPGANAIVESQGSFGEFKVTITHRPDPASRGAVSLMSAEAGALEVCK